MSLKGDFWSGENELKNFFAVFYLFDVSLYFEMVKIDTKRSKQ